MWESCNFIRIKVLSLTRRGVSGLFERLPHIFLLQYEAASGPAGRGVIFFITSPNY